jgi:hypothetical protein
MKELHEHYELLKHKSHDYHELPEYREQELQDLLAFGQSNA